jgi:hypothetical protein
MLTTTPNPETYALRQHQTRRLRRSSRFGVGPVGLFA